MDQLVVVQLGYYSHIAFGDTHKLTIKKRGLIYLITWFKTHISTYIPKRAMRNVSAARAKVEPRLFGSTAVSASTSLEADKLLENKIAKEMNCFRTVSSCFLNS